jgi:hypothetical protein
MELMNIRSYIHRFHITDEYIIIFIIYIGVTFLVFQRLTEKFTVNSLVLEVYSSVVTNEYILLSVQFK